MEKLLTLLQFQASDAGIGTVYQDLALNALTSFNKKLFFLGRELVKAAIWFNANG